MSLVGSLESKVLKKRIELKTGEFQLFGNKIFIRPDVMSTKGDAGIVIPGRENIMQEHGTVIAVGTGKILPDGTVLPIKVEVGDRVLFSPYNVKPFTVDDGAAIMLTDDDVIAKIWGDFEEVELEQNDESES